MKLNVTRLLLTLGGVVLLGWGTAQFSAVLLLDPCLGMVFSDGNSPQPLITLCTVTADVRVGGIGVFAQTRPIRGPFYEEWRASVYSPRGLKLLGFAREVQPGFTVGMEGGRAFFGASAPIIIELTVPRSEP